MRFSRIKKLTVFARNFFPFQIILGQFKYNLISLFYWTFLFLIVSDSLASAFGVPYLFFSPEYLGEISGWSFILLGFSVGGFTMAFNTYSYIKLGPRYPFLATVSRPFYKFCLNNSLIPLLFVSYYLFKMAQFQIREELADIPTILGYSSSFLLGFSSFILLSIFYFFPTTRDKGEHITHEESTESPIQTVTQSKEKWYDYFRTEKDRNYIYIGKRLKLIQSRGTKHLDKEVIEHVFAKNRINASIFEILTISSFFIFSLFREYTLFEFPAAMSIVLLLTMIHMLFSAMMSWFHRWTYPILFAVLLGLNYLSLHTPFFQYKNYAYGLSYQKHKMRNYDINEIEDLVLKDSREINSKKAYIKTLENWKKRTGQDKPKLIILNTSGGGSRSALWTFTILQKCDRELKGKLSDHLQLITGASGGMVGAAYYREILLRNRKGQLLNQFNPEYTENLGKDLLNKLAFSASTNDMFFRYQDFKYNGYTYTKDRGYAFEEQLHKNTQRIMDHTLGYYKSYEASGIIPVMIFSPTIVNDGRRLLISSQTLSFITENVNSPKQISRSYENIDYQSYFENNSPQKLRFSSALRASATFPFIMPMVTMPTFPEMQLMDAGIRDNYGGKTSMEFLFAMQDWIQKNTSGVIILEIRDTKRILNNESYQSVSLFDKFSLPFGNMYNNFPRTQDFDQEQLIKSGTAGLNFPVDVVTFNLRENKKDRISLSWHLTTQEKYKIDQAFYSFMNQISFRRLEDLLNH